MSGHSIVKTVLSISSSTLIRTVSAMVRDPGNAPFGTSSFPS
uniref:Uncharacterized protein n=1 Tax=Timema monikensis TaxID=170555 RepID=A0A7R9EMZ0_9NEOP|nr:unnamed protein product [Timema monikensis]